MQYNITNKTIEIMVDNELDHHVAALIKTELDSKILKGEITNIVFDFKNTTFMDSSGIGLIMGRYKLINAIGGKVKVKNIAGNLERIFVASGLFKLVERL